MTSDLAPEMKLPEDILLKAWHGKLTPLPPPPPLTAAGSWTPSVLLSFILRLLLIVSRIRLDLEA